MVAADSFMASRRAFLGSHILALILVSICLVNWDFNSNLSFLELDQVCVLARYHPHRSFNFSTSTSILWLKRDAILVRHSTAAEVTYHLG